MKPTCKFPALALAAALLLCLVLPALAQSKPAKVEAKPKTETEAKHEDPWKRRLPEIQYDGIPLGDVAQNLVESYFPEINFVVHQHVKDVPISLRLRSVTLEDIFTAIEIMTKGAPTATVDPFTGLPAQLEIKKVSDKMVAFTLSPTADAAATKPVCRAFSLNRYLASKSDKEVNEAISEIHDAMTTAWNMLREASPSSAKVSTPQVSLHRATKLLIVVGPPQQVEVVEQIISQLEGGPDHGEGASRYGVPGMPGGNPGPAGAGGGAIPGLSPFPGVPGKAR